MWGVFGLEGAGARGGEVWTGGKPPAYGPKNEGTGGEGRSDPSALYTAVGEGNLWRLIRGC